MEISGEQIKEARERRQLTQQDLADLVGVSSRTVGSWERGESIPRNRLGAVRQALHMDGEERDGRMDLARLIREQLNSDGMGPEGFAKKLPEKSRRAFYNWVGGTAAPRANLRPELEDALGWERGAVKRILDAPITEHISLAEVRDWSRVEDGVPRLAARASELSNAELLMELTARFQAMETELELLKAPSNVTRLGGPRSGPDRGPADLYDLAAHNTSAGRNMEHLEDDDDDQK